MPPRNPPGNKRRKASDDQLRRFINDLQGGVPELSAEQIGKLSRDPDRPSTAHIDTLRVLLDMKARGAPDHPGPTVVLPVRTSAGITAWSTVLDLSTYRRQGWTLVGGQMVHLLAWEHGEESPRVTTDADVVLDVRAYPNVGGSGGSGGAARQTVMPRKRLRTPRSAPAHE